MPEFQEIMVDACHQHHPVNGKVVLELASDPWFIAAKRFRTLGAKRVIASDMTENWQAIPDHSIDTGTIDARTVDQTLGRNVCDVVFGVNILEHLYNIDAVLESIYYTLKPGGLCFLHGHPIWTSARGHHAMLGYKGAQLVFHDPRNPIPMWGHLYLTPENMRIALAECSDEIIEAAIDWSFSSSEINRTPRREILNTASRSPLIIESVQEDSLEYPDGVVLDRIMSGPWWHPEERYDVRGITLVMRRP